MSKGNSNILANCFKKTTKNVRDYVPPTVKQENIREGIPIKFPENADLTYTADLLPNILFEEWPSEEEINSYDFTNNGHKYSDPNSNLIIFPFSLRKETYSSMVWLRPEEYMKKKNLITAIKEKYENKNYNYIKNKMDLAPTNLLNFEYNNNESDKEDEASENNNNKDNKENIENKENENKLPEIEKKQIFNTIDNMKISIKRRNSIDLANAEGVGSSLGREFYSSKLTEEEKKMFLENQEKTNEFIIVPHEECENNETVEPVANKPPVTNQKKGNEVLPHIHYNKLKPSNLNLSKYLCDFCRWVSSQYQILLDNNINTENDENNFLRKIYPQDKNGVPIYNSSGIYWVKLFHMGKYRKIVIDDKFPVNKETFENFLPQCGSPYELWPMILTKALIKLYSYKYKCNSYEKNEVGDCSILYSLTRFIGIKLPSFKFMKFLSDLQDIKNKQLLNHKENVINDNNNNEEIKNGENKENDKEKEKEKEEEKVDVILLNNKNSNEYGYDVIVGYMSSKPIIDPEEKIYRNGHKRNVNNLYINTEKNNTYEAEEFPLIEKNKNTINYTEKTYKIKNITNNLKNRKRLKSLKPQNMNIPPEYQKLYDKFNKFTSISTKKALDPYQRFQRYFEEHRFLTNDNLFQSYQNYNTQKTNKIHKSGIICDVGYTLLEIFQCGNFNMKRLKPIYFGDMKLDIKVKYKQMSPEEKAIYLDQIKELRIKQKKEKENRTNKYLDIGSNILCLKFTNESDCDNEKKVYQIETLYNLREIEAAKFCIKNNFAFPPEDYFKNTFIPKLSKDEETGEINFWTKNFYHKLLKNYFKAKEEEIKLMLEEKKRLERLKKEEEAKKKGEEYFPEEDNDNNEEENQLNLLQEFEEKSVSFNEDLNKSIESIIPGTWMPYDSFRECFDNFILFKNMDEFKNHLVIDNIWYNYDKDIYEEKENSNIIHLKKIDNENNRNNNTEINNILEESELYVVFEPNSEKTKKSVSSELSYEINEETKKGNKYNDLVFSISIVVYEIDSSNKKASKIASYLLKDYFSIININLSKLTKNPETKEFFINIQGGGLCPFGYHLQFLSNAYTLENYSFSQFLCDFKNFTEKKINIMHPILPKSQFYLLKTFVVELKKTDDENESKTSKFMTNFEGYDDNVLKNIIDVVLINSITNKKVKIYYKKIFEIDFSTCPKFRVELSIISPGNIPERNFDYILLYDNPNIHIEIFENIYPFYIRQKFIPNKHNILFNELVFPSEPITTTLDISLEYRPNHDEENNNTNNITNYTEENLPKEEPFPASIRMIFYFSEGEKLIFKKDFENQSLIRNLILEPKNLNQKDNKDPNYANNLILEAYSIKCVLDKEQCPSWLTMANEYKGDVYWKISIFSTDSITFIKNTIKEDKEKEVIESWEINEPGRKKKAEMSRKKYFVNIKYNNGELLTPEEEELIPEKIKRKEIIESNSNMLVTNIPPRAGNQPVSNPEDDKKQNDDIMTKLPKIKNYRSLFMKNFYMYSNQKRVVTKNKGGLGSSRERCGSLPNINQYCKTPEEREQELKEIEEKFNKYYEDMKKEEEKEESVKEKYYTIVQEMNDKIYEARQKITNASYEIQSVDLNKVIEKNNNMISKGREIEYLYEELKADEEINDDIFFDWYQTCKYLNEEINTKEVHLTNKYKNMFEEIKKKLGEIAKNRLEIVEKPETKAKPELIKKYKDIYNDNLLNLN